MLIRMVVAGQGYDGPDLYFCKLDVPEEAIEEGHHYDLAKVHAKNYGFEGQMIAFDENDNPRRLFDLFNWDSASVFKHSTKRFNKS